MQSLDPLGLAHSFSQASEIAKKKEQKNSATKTKSKSFATILQTNQAEQEISSEMDIEYLHAIEGKSFDDTLQYLVDSVYSAGDKLKKNPSADEFKSYRKSLSHFLEFIVKNTYEIETHQRIRGRKRVVYTLVNVVNEKLDKLANGILFNQNDQLNILARVEEINGLLVDFFS